MLLAQIILVAQVCHLRRACDGLTLGIPQFMRISKKKNDIFKKMLGNCSQLLHNLKVSFAQIVSLAQITSFAQIVSFTYTIM